MSANLTSLEEYQRLLAGSTSEADLLATVELRLAVGKWRWHHIGRSDLAQQHGDPGFLDILAIRGDTLLVRELKAVAGRFGTGQREWLAAFEGVRRVDVGTWRPTDRTAIEEGLG